MWSPVLFPGFGLGFGLEDQDFRAPGDKFRRFPVGATLKMIIFNPY